MQHTRQGACAVSRTRLIAPVLCLGAIMAVTVTVTGCGKETRKVSAAPSQADGKEAFDQRAAQIVRDWPKVSPVEGHHEKLMPLPGADRPRNREVRELTVTVGHGACDTGYGAHTLESEHVVVISGWSRKKPSVQCSEQLIMDQVKVHLKHPLAGRSVVDAVTGRPLLGG